VGLSSSPQLVCLLLDYLAQLHVACGGFLPGLLDFPECPHYVLI
jgi:hypothetical protein